MSGPVCTTCVLDIEDCVCAGCLCGGCQMNGCRCNAPSDESLDIMIAKASVPNLGALYRQGQASGMIKPIADYPKGSAG